MAAYDMHYIIHFVYLGLFSPYNTCNTCVSSVPTCDLTLRNPFPFICRSVNYDPFKQVAAVRSLLFPGYTFYYAGHEATWGAFYHGDGTRNNDLIFML